MRDNLAQLKKRLNRVGERVPCPIWMTGDTFQRFQGPDARVIKSPSQTYDSYDSPRAGGVFRFDQQADDEFKASAETQIQISRWIYDKNQLGEIGYLTSEEIERIEKQERLRIDQRTDRLLQCFARLPAQVPDGLCTSGRKNLISRNDLQIVHAATECSTYINSDIPITEELNWLMSAAVENGWLERRKSDAETYLRLTPVGVQRLEELETKAVNSEQAFVAMWFDESVNEAWEKGIERAIRDSGYRSLRIDKKEHNNKIDDEIIAEIRRSRFIICDFTCGLIEHGGKQIAIPRGGVYYEAGFAQGLGIPVIWMCHADHIEHVHFDTRQFNHITWNTPEELREKLRNRIGAVIGDGPLKDR